MLGVPARPVPCCFLYYQAGIMLGSFRLKAWQAKPGHGTFKMLVELVARGLEVLVNESIQNAPYVYQPALVYTWVGRGVKLVHEVHACGP